MFKSINSESIKVPLNFALYNLGWFVAVGGAGKSFAYAGPIFSLIFLTIHLLLLKQEWKIQAKFILSAMLIGSTIDSILPAFGLITFSAPTPAYLGVYPIWMVSLWGNFATTFSLCLRWMQERYLLGAIFGALGGPASLYAGGSLNAATVNSAAFYYSAIEWAVIVPLLLVVHKKLVKS